MKYTSLLLIQPLVTRTNERMNIWNFFEHLNPTHSTWSRFEARNDYIKFSSFVYLQMVTRTKKIFVGGLSAPTTLEDVKSYFEQFGTVSNFFLLTLFSLESCNSVFVDDFLCEYVCGALKES